MVLVSDYKYDVGISYATEDEEYVGRVIKLLKERYQLKVFFAPAEQGNMIGEDLLIYLNKVYNDECHYVVVFISEKYLSKEYTRQEASIIKLRQATEKQRFIIPVVFGSARLDWMSKDIVYLSADKTVESEVAYYINEKIRKDKTDFSNKAPNVSNSAHKSIINNFGNNNNVLYVNNISNSQIQPRTTDTNKS